LPRATQPPTTTMDVMAPWSGMDEAWEEWQDACVQTGEDCRGHSKCCDPGSTCFVKNDIWAACNKTCDPLHSQEGLWRCTVWGAKSTTTTTTTPRPPPTTTITTTTEDDSECAWEGEDCMRSKCCRNAGFKCFEQIPGVSASCSDACGSLTASALERKLQDTWSCKVIGGNHGTGALPPAEEGNAAGTSLFCFTVATSQGVTGPGVKPGYEQHLLNLFKSRKVGLCACDAWTTYEGARVSMGSWQAVVNADMFIKVWKQVEKEQTYKAHDWTVKVDSDAVFLPDRLKQHIQALRPPKDAPVYLRNIDFKWKFQGALEVLSKMAVEVYLQNADICRHHLSHNRGEDSYMKACLEAIWVGHMEDFTLLNDKATHPKGWNIFDVDDCTNPSVVALHPYRAANSWWACYEVATGLKKTSDFVGCGHRWPGDACSMTSKRVHEDASSGLAEPRSLTLAWPSQLRRKL